MGAWRVWSCIVLLALAACGEEPASSGGAGAPEEPARAEDSPVPEADDPDDGEEPEGAGTDSGRWRKARPHGELSDEQKARIAQLEALGYLSGSEPAGELSGVTIHDPERAQDGLNIVVSGHRPQADLMTMDGRILHSWSLPYTEAFPFKHVKEGTRTRRNADGPGTSHHMWRRVRLLPGGGLLAIYEFHGLVMVDRKSRKQWAWDDMAHHDLDVDPKGRIHVLGRRADVVPSFHEDRPILEDFLVMLNSRGVELRRVSVLEALEQSEFAHVLDEVRGDGGDILHTNTIQFLLGRHAKRSPIFARGNLLISCRKLSLLAIIDPRQRKAVWALQGPWRRQHEPVMLRNGNMLLFDNGTEKARRSSVLEIDPLGGEVVWRYQQDEPDVFYSQSCGVVQPLAGGNVLVTESVYGRAFELTRDREIVWEFHSPYRAGENDELVATLFDVVRIDRAEVEDWLPAE